MVLTTPGQSAVGILAQDLAAQRVGSAVSLRGAASSCPAAQLWATAPALGHVLRPHGGDTRPAQARCSNEAPGQPVPECTQPACLRASEPGALPGGSGGLGHKQLRDEDRHRPAPRMPQAGEWPGGPALWKGPVRQPASRALCSGCVMGLQAGAGGGAGEVGAAVSL